MTEAARAFFGAQQTEHAELDAETLRRLREDVAVLRAATTFFVGELDPRTR